MLRTTSLLSILVLALAAPAFGIVFLFEDRGLFDTERTAQGCTDLLCTETFEEALVPPAGIGCMVYPLQHNVPNNPDGNGFPNGLTCPLDMWSTYMDPNCDTIVLGAGFIGNATNVVGANFFAARTNAEFSEYGGYCAVGFEVMDPITGGNGTIDVYDMSNVLIGSFNVPFNVTETWYGLVVTPDQGPIGRIEFYGDDDGGELSDNWELYVPEPATISLLALGSLVMVRRR